MHEVATYSLVLSISYSLFLFGFLLNFFSAFNELLGTPIHRLSFNARVCAHRWRAYFIE